MLQFDLQFYEELTVAWVRTVKFISGAFFWPTGQLVFVCFFCTVISFVHVLVSSKKGYLHKYFFSSTTFRYSRLKKKGFISGRRKCNICDTVYVLGKGKIFHLPT